MTNPTPHGQVPAIQRYSIGYHSDEWGVRSLSPVGIYDDAGKWVRYEDHAAVITALRTQQPAPATQQAPQQPCPTCAALARTVMLDQVSFDRKPDCYGIRQITEDEGVEEWEDIRTSPDVAREEANDMMATGRGEIYEVVPLWTTPQPPSAQAAESVPAVDEDGERYRYLIETLDDQPHGKPTIGAAWDDDIGFWTKGSFFGLKDKASIDAAIDADRKQGDAE